MKEGCSISPLFIHFKTTLKRVNKLMLYALNFLFFTIIYVGFFLNRWRLKGIKNFTIRTLMYLYIILVIMVTLMPFEVIDFIPDGNNSFLESVNLVPYRDIFAGYGGAVRETILNIIMLLPFGFLLPLIKKTNVVRVLCWSLLFSLFIELSQLYLTWIGGSVIRSFDVTDLINNSIGGMIGFIINRNFSFIIRKL